jgi:hypothetical protein
MRVLIKLLILVLLSTTVQAETCLQTHKDEPWECYGGVCGLDQHWYEYGRKLMGSECFDWSANPDARLFCILDWGTVQVYSFRECNELGEKTGSRAKTLEHHDPSRRLDGSLYRHNWCAAHCTYGLPLPYDCADWSCPE